jgi:hypothetical protein
MQDLTLMVSLDLVGLLLLAWKVVTLNRAAPGIEPDLDDSAKASIVLSLAGKSGFSSSIVKEFDAATCLKTYRGERDPSVSANCNALMSLLLDPHEYVGKSAIIEKIVDFIFAEWAASKGKIKDKWVCRSLNNSKLIISLTIGRTCRRIIL